MLSTWREKSKQKKAKAEVHRNDPAVQLNTLFSKQKKTWSQNVKKSILDNLKYRKLRRAHGICENIYNTGGIVSVASQLQLQAFHWRVWEAVTARPLSAPQSVHGG